MIEGGATLPIGQDETLENTGQKLPRSNRYSGGTVRFLPSVQTARFSKDTLNRFQETEFSRTPRGNRQGAELTFAGGPFASDDQLSILSEPMVAGDIQMTGTGVPFVLLPECQTTGGYPRIGTVLPDDLPIISQATPGTKFKFKLINHADATLAHHPLAQRIKDLKSNLEPLIRNPHDIRDLLSYQLISGMITGQDEA